MEVIVTAVAELGSAVLGLITEAKKAKFGRLPDWLTAADFQRKDNTLDIIFYGLIASFLLIVIATVIIASKKK